MRHQWGEPDRTDVHATLRECARCGLVKVTRHEPDNNPRHWVEWRRHGVPIKSDKTPRCAGAKE